MRRRHDEATASGPSGPRPSGDDWVPAGAIALAVVALVALSLLATGPAAATAAADASVGASATAADDQIEGEWWDDHEWWVAEDGCRDGTVPPSGEVTVAVLLAQYANDDAEDTADPDDVESLLFGDDPEVASGPGSFADYYAEASDGELELTPGPEGVGGWYELDVERSDVDGASRTTVEAAIRAADAEGFDFAAYDDDGDGCVAVQVLTSGEFVGGDGIGIKSELSTGGDPVTVDGVTVDDYTIQPVLRNGDLRGIGLLAHEFGHQLGLPDLYTDGGIDRWGVMGYGYRGAIDGPSALGESPLEPTAWSKNRLGWAETTALPHRHAPGILPSAANHSLNYRLDVPGATDYVLLEARGDDGFDRGMELWYGNDPGVLAWHVDPSASNGGDQGDRLDVTHLEGAGETLADGPERAAPVDGLDSGVRLANVTDTYGTYQFNDPPERSLEEGAQAAYAVPVGAGLPADESPPGRVDARVSWQDPTADVDLELYAPDGTLVDDTDDTEESFAVVQSDREPTTGSWTLLERASDGDATYVATSSYPTYPLPTDVEIVGVDASDDEDVPADDARAVDSSAADALTLDVRVESGDRPYSPGAFGTLDAGQFDVQVDGESVDASDADLTRTDVGAYTLDVDPAEGATDDSTVSVAVTDWKLGASYGTDPDRTVVGADQHGTVSADDPDATATEWLEDTALWVGETVAAPGEQLPFAVQGPLPPESSVSWEFSDGATASGPVVGYSFETAGDYDAEVTVTGPDGETATDAVTVTVAEPPTEPVPVASAEHDVVAVGEPVTVRADGSFHPDGRLAEYYWNVGGDAVETGPTTTHVFETPGTHEVELRVVGDRGAAATDTLEIEVRGDAESPFASLETSDTTVNVGEPFGIDGSASRSPVGASLSCAIDLGDGTTVTSSSCETTHHYEEPGAYDVELRAVDEAGRTSSETATVTVDDELEPPEPVLDVSDQTVAVGETVIVSSSGTTVPDGVLERSEYSFGDGTSEEQRYVAVHSYDEPGRYDLELQVVDSNGLVATETAEISVGEPGPIASIDETPTTVAAGESFRLSADTEVLDGDLAALEWDLGDGTEIDVDDPVAVDDGTGDTDRDDAAPETITHSYTSIGSYEVTLRAIDDRGRTDETSTEIVVDEAAEPTQLVVDDYENPSAWAADENALGDRTLAGRFESQDVADGTLTLAYDDAGWFVTTVLESVEGYERLALDVRGETGGEGADVKLSVGESRDTLAALSGDRVGTEFSTVTVDLDDVDLDRLAPGQLRLTVPVGTEPSSTIEIDEIRFE